MARKEYKMSKEALVRQDSAETFPVEIVVKARHHFLLEFRRKNKISQKELGERVGARTKTVGLWERFAGYPRDPNVMERLCELTEKEPEELFPSFIRDQKFLKIQKTIRFVRDANIKDLQVVGIVPLALPSPAEAYEQKELQKKVSDVLATLTSREEKVLRKYFGIGQLGDQTLDEVAKDMGVTPERIRQISAKAVRKLRHPSRSRKLKAFVEP